MFSSFCFHRKARTEWYSIQFNLRITLELKGSTPVAGNKQAGSNLTMRLVKKKKKNACRLWFLEKCC